MSTCRSALTPAAHYEQRVPILRAFSSAHTIAETGGMKVEAQSHALLSWFTQKYSWGYFGHFRAVTSPETLKGKPPKPKVLGAFGWWLDADLCRRPRDYEALALPTYPPVSTKRCRLLHPVGDIAWTKRCARRTVHPTQS